MQHKRDVSQGSKKLEEDAYDTPSDLASYCIQKTKAILDSYSISEFLEPSAGAGSFSLLIEGVKAFDLRPRHSSIVSADFLTLDIPYLEGRCILGNPPWGARNLLAFRFLRRSAQLGDFISFILPISQLNNSRKFTQFKLIHSEDLGIRDFSGHSLHTCLNIWIRGENHVSKDSSQWIIIGENRRYKKLGRKNKSSRVTPDIRICGWGSSLGKELLLGDSYAKEFCIKVLVPQYKSQILSILRSAQWLQRYPRLKSPNLAQWQIYEYVNREMEVYLSQK